MVARADFRGERALARAVTESSCDVGKCLMEVRQVYGIPPREASAADAWKADDAHRKQTTHGVRGYPFFWSGGSQGFGHIAICLGGDLVRTTDWRRGGVWGTARIRDISAAWGLSPLGITLRVNGQSVWAPTVDLSMMVWVAKHAPHKGGTVAVRRMIRYTELALVGAGMLSEASADGTWSTFTTAAYKRWQGHLGHSKTGIPTAGELRALFRRPQQYGIVRP
jgi:hypothetical protein